MFQVNLGVTQSVKKNWADWVTPKICLKCVSSKFRGHSICSEKLSGMSTQSGKKKLSD